MAYKWGLLVTYFIPGWSSKQRVSSSSKTEGFLFQGTISHIPPTRVTNHQGTLVTKPLVRLFDISHLSFGTLVSSNHFTKLGYPSSKYWRLDETLDQAEHNKKTNRPPRTCRNDCKDVPRCNRAPIFFDPPCFFNRNPPVKSPQQKIWWNATKRFWGLRILPGKFAQMLVGHFEFVVFCVAFGALKSHLVFFLFVLEDSTKTRVHVCSWKGFWSVLLVGAGKKNMFVFLMRKITED